MASKIGEQPIATTAPAAYEGVGYSLRVVRERKKLALEDVSARLRIRRQHLAAIEAGNFAELPGPVYITGFLRSYAEFLGLDPSQVISNFQAESDMARRRPVLNFPMPRPEARTPRLWLVVAGIAAAIVVYAVWYRYQESMRLGAELIKPVPDRLAELIPPPAPPRPAAPPRMAEVPIASPIGTNTANASPARPLAQVPAVPAAPAAASPGIIATPAPPATNSVQPSATPLSAIPASNPAMPTQQVAILTPKPALAPAAQPQSFGNGGRVVIQAESDSWVQVRQPGGEPLFTRLMSAGERYQVPDKAGLTLATGNAGGLRLTLDGQALAPLGENGEVKRNISLMPADLQPGARRE